MGFDHITWIGINPYSQAGKGHNLITYAAIDKKLRLLALSQGSIDDLKAYLGGQSAAYVAVGSPRRPCLDINAIEQEVALFPDEHSKKPSRGRLADQQLREHNLGHLRIPSSLEKCPAWMRRGFNIFELLDTLGFHDYPADPYPLQKMEVYPQATFTLLIGNPPLPRKTLEGRLQRQLILSDKDLDIPDPMRFFEEVTRHRLRIGLLPLKEVYLPTELDALASAYTAWLAATNPQSVMLYGDAREGQVVVPVGLIMPKLVPEPPERHEYALFVNN